MTHKFRSNPRFQLICLAASSAVAASCVGIYAFLSDETEPLEAHFQMSTSNNMEVNIDTKDFEDNAEIIPGDAAAFDPYISNDGDQDAYVFMQVTVPHESFHLKGINEKKWALLSQDDETAVYYYGTNEKLSVLPKAKHSVGSKNNTSVTPSLCTSIVLDDDTPLLDDTYRVSAIGYAIQTKGFEDKTPQQVWSNLQ